MAKRIRTRQTLSSSDRVKKIAAGLKAKAAKLKPGREKDSLLRKARNVEARSEITQL